MTFDLHDLLEVLRGGDDAEIVPRRGMTAALTAFSAGAMAFLAVFAMALSMAAGRLADRWEAELALHATVRITASESAMADRVEAVLRVLQTTPGVASARALDMEEQRALLEPWFGADLPLEDLPMPQLVEVVEDRAGGLDAAGLQLRLTAEAPGAVLDDHNRWRAPLTAAADRLRAIGVVSILLIAAVTGAMVTLAAQSALAANRQVISVLRLVGARDGFIAQVFVRRFTLRALAGGAGGTLAGALAVSLLPEAQDAGGLLTGLSLKGWQWLWVAFLPLLIGAVAFAATTLAARRSLRDLP